VDIGHEQWRKANGKAFICLNLCDMFLFMTSCSPIRNRTHSTCISNLHVTDSRIFYFMIPKLLSCVIILKSVCNLKKEAADSSDKPLTTIRLQGIIPKNPLSPWRWQHLDSPKRW